MTVLVKGAGVAGLSVARELFSRGLRVEVCDRLERPAAGASGLAGGMLAPFCEREAACETVLNLGLQAADWWDEAVPGCVTRNGTLVVAPARDTGELARFASRTRGYEWLDEEGVAALEPSLAGRFRKGLFFREEAHLDPRAVLSALHRKLEDGGVRFHFGVPADFSDASFRHVVDCTGAAAIGSTGQLRGVRGEMLYLATGEVSLSRAVRLLHPRHPIYVVPREAGHFMVGATMIENEDDGPVSARSLMELLNAAYALHSAFGEARVVETGVGVRPAYPDNLPRVTGNGRTLQINGLYRHGFLLSPALAREAAGRISGGSDQMRRQA